MRLLLDTHVFLWWLADDQRLSPRCREQIANPINDVMLSAVTVWELAIKLGLGKLEMEPSDAERLHLLAADNGFDELPISAAHAAEVRLLPAHHRDPFDRLLVAQAQSEGLTVVTADPAIHPYQVAVMVAGTKSSAQ